MKFFGCRRNPREHTCPICLLSSMPPTRGNTYFLFTLGDGWISCYVPHETYVAFPPGHLRPVLFRLHILLYHPRNLCSISKESSGRYPTMLRCGVSKNKFGREKKTRWRHDSEFTSTKCWTRGPRKISITLFMIFQPGQVSETGKQEVVFSSWWRNH